MILEDDDITDDLVLFKCQGCKIEWWGESDDYGECEICGMIADRIEVKE